jgi:hypothetical protein
MPTLGVVQEFLKPEVAEAVSVLVFARRCEMNQVPSDFIRKCQQKNPPSRLLYTFYRTAIARAIAADAEK